MARVGLAILWVGAATVAALAFVLPLGFAATEAAAGAGADFTLSARQFDLLLRGTGIALGSASLACLGGALVAAVVLASPRRRRTVLFGLALSSLLTPPYIFAYAWSLLLLPGGLMTASLGASGLHAWLATTGRAVLCLGAWTSPLAAFVLSHAWRRHAAPAYRAMLLDTSAPRALVHCAVRILPGWVGLSLLACFTLCLTEFTVCHLCRVPTWNTEVLAALQLSGPSGGAWRFAAPPLAFVGALSAAGLVVVHFRPNLFARPPGGEFEDAAASACARWSATGGMIVWLAVALALLLPWILLLAHLRQPSALVHCLRVFAREWPDGLLVAGLSALFCAALAAGLEAIALCAARSRSRAARPGLLAGLWLVTLLALIAGLLPGVLIGDAFALAAVHLPNWLRDSAAFVGVVGVARFALVPIGWVLLDRRAEKLALLDLAASDGATFPRSYLRVTLPASRPALLGGSIAAGVLCLTEVTATQFVVPPGLGSLSVTLLNEIHFGRQDDVIALCLCVLAFVAAVGALLGALRRRGNAQEY